MTKPDTDFSHFWWGALGGPATALLARGFGLLLCLSALGRLGSDSVDQFLERYPPSLVVLALSGFALLLFGPRLLALLVAALAAGDLLRVVVSGGEDYPRLGQQAAEYPYFIAIPVGLLLLTFVARLDGGRLLRWRVGRSWGEFNRRFEEYAVCFFRLLALVTLFLVSFHKLNWDFFDPAVSCEGFIKGIYSRNWEFAWYPALTSVSSPLLVLLLEGPVAIVLLLFFRRWGILLVAFVYTLISFCNAIVVTLTVIVPVLAFLSREDFAACKRHRLLLGAVFVVLLAVFLPLSHESYHGVRPWFQYAVHHVLVAGIAVIAGGSQVIALLGGRKANNDCGRAGARPSIALDEQETSDPSPTPSAKHSLAHRLGCRRMRLLPSRRAGKAACLALTAVLLLNGLSPYLGLKFNYSFAMLSNLRTDDARWNHMIVPEQVRLTRYDPYVRVHRARMTRRAADGQRREQRPPLREGRMYSPQALHERLKDLPRAGSGTELELDLEYQGTSHEYRGQAGSGAFRAFLQELPPRTGHWFHDVLPMEGPQPCKH